jgi:hypothetical protein
MLTANGQSVNIEHIRINPLYTHLTIPENETSRLSGKIMSVLFLNLSSLASRAELHASLFAKMHLSSDCHDQGASILGLYQNYEIHPEYRHAFVHALVTLDTEQGSKTQERFHIQYQTLLVDQLQQLIAIDPSEFHHATIEQVADMDAVKYSTLHAQNNAFQSPQLWDRIVLGLGHPPYRTAFISALMYHDVSPYAFHQDLKRFKDILRDLKDPQTPKESPGAVLNHLAERHAALYINPMLREQAGYDKTRLMGDIFALKGDPEYTSIFEHTLIETDAEFGSLYLYWFRKDIQHFEAHRKELDENTKDLMGFGPLSQDLVALDDDKVLQGGMAGILRTAHGHSEKGLYGGGELPKRSFAAALESIKQ